MKGAIAEPPVNTINAPKSSMNMMIGRSQNFFRTFKKPQRSFRKSISLIPFKSVKGGCCMSAVLQDVVNIIGWNNGILESVAN